HAVAQDADFKEQVAGVAAALNVGEVGVAGVGGEIGKDAAELVEYRRQGGIVGGALETDAVFVEQGAGFGLEFGGVAGALFRVVEGDQEAFGAVEVAADDDQDNGLSGRRGRQGGDAVGLALTKLVA